MPSPPSDNVLEKRQKSTGKEQDAAQLPAQLAANRASQSTFMIPDNLVNECTRSISNYVYGTGTVYIQYVLILNGGVFL